MDILRVFIIMLLQMAVCLIIWALMIGIPIFLIAVASKWVLSIFV